MRTPRDSEHWISDPSVVAAMAAAECVRLPERSGKVTVRDARERVVRYQAGRDASQWERAAVGALARAGVCVADAAAVVTAAQAPGPGARVDLMVTMMVLNEWFKDLAGRYPEMGVRDGLGWVLVAAAFHEDRLPPVSWASKTIEPWEQAGFGEGAWVYASAGLTPAEARVAVDAQSVTEDDARALAALRGVSLPA